MPSVFLAHSSRDKRFVRNLSDRLKQRNLHVWVDEAELNIGESLVGKIFTAIDTADYVAAILSRNSVSSNWVTSELHFAMTQEIGGRRVKVLPILIEPCEIPKFLADKLYADFTKPENYEQEFLKLLNAIQPSQSDNRPHSLVKQAEQMEKMRKRLETIITESEIVLKQACEAVSEARNALRVSRDKSQLKSSTLYEEAEEKLKSAKDKVILKEYVDGEPIAKESYSLAKEALNTANEEHEYYKKIREEKVKNARKRIPATLIGYPLLFGFIGMVGGLTIGYFVLGDAKAIAGFLIGFVISLIFGTYNVIKELYKTGSRNEDGEDGVAL